jgi:hypothetical protein
VHVGDLPHPYGLLGAVALRPPSASLPSPALRAPLTRLASHAQTSQNPLKAAFAEYPFHAFRKIERRGAGAATPRPFSYLVYPTFTQAVVAVRVTGSPIVVPIPSL